ncbi:MAG: ATP-grasp domain-containing protein [Prevotellaceae bacterium]|jgi:D-alanine-D-alanine ligase|nr:ATP-grasp domain-containing protein [Prevotellaceae bacterium]
MNKKLNIAILFGGNSSEKIISEYSSHTIARYLPTDKYSAYRVAVSHNLWTVELDGNHIDVDKNDFSFTHSGTKIVFDCAYIIIHGTPGENGLLQAYFEILNIPYTSCNSFVSALTFDKYACKCYLRDLGVKLSQDILLRPNETAHDLPYPLFVKPNAGGSSFGVSKVHSAENLQPAIDAAFAEGAGNVLLETFIAGVEFSHGIFITHNRTLEFPVTQIISETDFFDYTAKYEGKSKEITPANIPDLLANRIRQETRRIAAYLGCHGLVRIDYIYSNDELYFLEINTVPGMSEASLVPQQIVKAGYSVAQILDFLVEDSISRTKTQK